MNGSSSIYGIIMKSNNENNDSYKWDDLWLLIGVNKFDGLFNYVANWLLYVRVFFWYFIQLH